MASKINGGGHRRYYVLLTSVCANKKNDFPIEDRYSGLIFQHYLANIINVSQGFIKLIHKPTKPHGIIGNFTRRQNINR